MQFPLGFFNAEFTARAASETSDNILIRKVKRIQKKFAKQIRDFLIVPMLRHRGKKIKPEDVLVQFEFESKSELSAQDVMLLFEKGGIKRGELRKYLNEKTIFDIDTDDMEDTPPITSVTPTNDMRTSQPSQAAQGQEPETQTIRREIESLKKLVEEKLPKPRGRPKHDDSDEHIEKCLDCAIRVIEPFGPFKDFADCVEKTKIKRPELSDVAVRRICGALQRDLESREVVTKKNKVLNRILEKLDNE